MATPKVVTALVKHNIFEIVDLKSKRVIGLHYGPLKIPSLFREIVKCDCRITHQRNEDDFGIKIIERVEKHLLKPFFFEIFRSYFEKGIVPIPCNMESLQFLTALQMDYIERSRKDYFSNSNYYFQGRYSPNELKSILIKLETTIRAKVKTDYCDLAQLELYYEVLCVFSLIYSCDLSIHEFAGTLSWKRTYYKVERLQRDNIFFMKLRSLRKIQGIRHNYVIRRLDFNFVCYYINKIIQVNGGNSRVSLTILNNHYLFNEFRRHGTKDMNFWNNHGFFDSKQVYEFMTEYWSLYVVHHSKSLQKNESSFSKRIKKTYLSF